MPSHEDTLERGHGSKQTGTGRGRDGMKRGTLKEGENRPYIQGVSSWGNGAEHKFCRLAASR